MSDAPRLPGFSRRSLLATIAAAPALTIAPAAAQSISAAERMKAALHQPGGTRLAILGSGGGPGPGRMRKMTSHAMLSNGAAYVLDCGLGVTDYFAQTGIPFGAVNSIFITHHHADHNIEYGPFLIVGWIQGMKQSVRAYGPPPLKDMTENFLRAYGTTIDFWAEDFKMTPLGMIEVGEVAAAGPVMQDANVKVSAIIVDHPPVKPALAYRFDFHDRSIVFSGDTAPLEAVARLAKGADVLVHEAMDVPAVEGYVRALLAARPQDFDAFMAHMKAGHTPLEDVGRIAAEAGVKTLVLSHLTPALENISDETWRAPVAKSFKGEIVVARDLTVV